MKVQLALFFVIGLFVGSICEAQENSAAANDSTTWGFNDEKIDWYYPNDFDSAKESAKDNVRILLVKGLGFGLDELGATCATKGCW